MVYGDILREDAEWAADPSDIDFGELAGVAPPCDECRRVEAVAEYDGRPLCHECAPEERA